LLVVRQFRDDLDPGIDVRDTLIQRRPRRFRVRQLLRRERDLELTHCQVEYLLSLGCESTDDFELIDFRRIHTDLHGTKQIEPRAEKRLVARFLKLGDARFSVKRLLGLRHQPKLSLETLIEVCPRPVWDTSQPVHAQFCESAFIGEAIEVWPPSAEIPAARQSRHPETVARQSTVRPLLGTNAGAVPSAVVFEPVCEEPCSGDGVRQCVVDIGLQADSSSFA